MTTTRMLGVTRGGGLARLGASVTLALCASTAAAQLPAFRSTPGAALPTPVDIQRALNAAYDGYKSLREGKNADYIPALAKVNPDLFGIALVTVDGRVFV